MARHLLRCLLALAAACISAFGVASAATAATPPTARFTYSPTAPIVGQAVTFDGTGSSCPGAPCTYSWSDDGSPSRPPTPLWPLGSGATLKFTFHEAGTKYVRLVITDAGGQTSTMEHNVTVSATAPSSPIARFTYSPTAPVVGGAVAFDATSSSCSDAPCTYSWSDDGSSTPPPAPLWPLGSGATLKFTFHEAGTKYVRLTITDAGGQTATVEHNVVVAAAPVEEKPKTEEPAEEPTETKSTGCSVVLSGVSGVSAALKAGAVVCLAGGSYGQVSITTTPSGNATLTAAPGAHVVVAGVNIAASNITVSQLHSTGAINVGSGSPYPGFSHDVIEHNDVGPTNGYGISVMSATGTPSSYITIKGNRIHDTSTSSEGDALRFDGWNNITVTENDIYNIKECASDTCHTDTLQSYNGGVPTTGLTVTRNYTHDNVGAQGLPFLKDGDISNVTISDNLSLHNTNTNGQVTGIWVDENINNLTITNNTYQETSGSIVQADGSAKNPTVNINHNVFDNLNVRPGSGTPYTVTEDYDIFTQNDEYTFKLGPHSTINTKPLYQDITTNNYQLATNPNNIGINWNPTQQQYGPTN